MTILLDTKKQADFTFKFSQEKNSPKIKVSFYQKGFLFRTGYYSSEKNANQAIKRFLKKEGY